MDTLISIRAALGLTQKELGERLKLTQSAISYYEKMDDELPSRVALPLIRIANEAGLPITLAHIYEGAPMPALEQPETKG